MEQLIEMGFTDEQVGRALDATNGNFELAVDYLLSANQRILPQVYFYLFMLLRNINL